MDILTQTQSSNDSGACSASAAAGGDKDQKEMFSSSSSSGPAATNNVISNRLSHLRTPLRDLLGLMDNLEIGWRSESMNMLRPIDHSRSSMFSRRVRQQVAGLLRICEKSSHKPGAHPDWGSVLNELKSQVRRDMANGRSGGTQGHEQSDKTDQGKNCMGSEKYSSSFFLKHNDPTSAAPVSYTHLTLPTKA